MSKRCRNRSDTSSKRQKLDEYPSKRLFSQEEEVFMLPPLVQTSYDELPAYPKRRSPQFRLKPATWGSPANVFPSAPPKELKMPGRLPLHHFQPLLALSPPSNAAGAPRMRRPSNSYASSSLAFADAVAYSRRSLPRNMPSSWPVQPDRGNKGTSAAAVASGIDLRNESDDGLVPVHRAQAAHGRTRKPLYFPGMALDLPAVVDLGMEPNDNPPVPYRHTSTPRVQDHGPVTSIAAPSPPKAIHDCDNEQVSYRHTLSAILTTDEPVAAFAKCHAGFPVTDQAKGCRALDKPSREGLYNAESPLPS